jgi:ERF superfamily
MVGDDKKVNVYTVVEMETTFVNADDPIDRFSVTTWGYGIDRQDKSIGKAITYATKYAMLKGFCLETGDDPENDSIDAGAVVDGTQRSQTTRRQTRQEAAPATADATKLKMALDFVATCLGSAGAADSLPVYLEAHYKGLTPEKLAEGGLRDVMQWSKGVRAVYDLMSDRKLTLDDVMSQIELNPDVYGAAKQIEQLAPAQLKVLIGELNG